MRLPWKFEPCVGSDPRAEGWVYLTCSTYAVLRIRREIAGETAPAEVGLLIQKVLEVFGRNGVPLGDIHRMTLGDIPGIEAHNCEDIAPAKCEECDGTGECSCHCGDVHECPTCEGTGTEDKAEAGCPLCDDKVMVDFIGMKADARILQALKDALAKFGASGTDELGAAVVQLEMGKPICGRIVPADGSWEFVFMGMRF